MVYITQVHMVGGTGHEHIAAVKWRTPDNSKKDEHSVAEMVRWMTGKHKGVVKVMHGLTAVDVHVYRDKYLRTKANGEWSDNLLSLPRY